ncbi:MAG: polyphenol oxidase family protein [Acidobacteriota bacterium]
MAHPIIHTTIPFAFPGLPQVGVAFTTALTGNISHAVGDDPEEVDAAREALGEALGFDTWHSLKQVHGVDMAFDAPESPLGEPSAVVADGQATDQPGRALVVKTADCQPILLAHESGKYVAGLHVGWRGNVLEFPQAGVKAFCERYGLRPQELLAVRGPSLGPGASEFTNFEMEFGERFRPFHDPASSRVNLWRLAAAQLDDAGLLPERIFGLDLCTFDLPLFFSYRREKNLGRQASLIWIRKRA